MNTTFCASRVAARSTHIQRGLRGLLQSSIAAISVLGLLAGCAAKMPACSDESTLKTVMSMFEGQMVKILQMTGQSLTPVALVVASTDIRSIRTVGKDEKLGTVSCDGTLAIALPAKVAETVKTPGNIFLMMIQPMGVTVKDGRLEKAIEYTAQFTDDKRQVIVEATGVEELGQLAAILGREGIFDTAEKPSQMTPEASNKVVEPKPSMASTTPQPGPVGVVAAAAPAPQEQPTPAATPPKSTPSFSCAGKLSSAEQMICDTPELADADSRLAQGYAAALNNAPDANLLKKQQRDWRRGRDACADASCMKGAYDKRIVELSR